MKIQQIAIQSIFVHVRPKDHAYRLADAFEHTPDDFLFAGSVLAEVEPLVGSGD